MRNRSAFERNSCDSYTWTLC